MADTEDSVSGSENDFNSPTSPGPSTSRKSGKSTRKDRGAAKYRSKFNPAWKKQYPFVTEVRTDKHRFYCTIYKRNVKCGHMGLSDVQRHISTSMHRRYAKDTRSQTNLAFASLSSHVTEKTMRAELIVATMLVQHNIPFAVADELTPLFRDIFSDSEIPKNCSSRKTKPACIINGAVAPFFQ